MCPASALPLFQKIVKCVTDINEEEVLFENNNTCTAFTQKKIRFDFYLWEVLSPTHLLLQPIIQFFCFGFNNFGKGVTRLFINFILLVRLN